MPIVLDCVLTKARPPLTVEVALTLTPGRWALFGPSGSGKSTLLSCIAGLENPDRGHIRYDGEDWFPPPRPLNQRALGYLTQKERLFPHVSVAENVMFALKPPERRRERPWIEELRSGLGLTDLWEMDARSLSGGQARRVALARTLCRRPRLVLLDEPFAGLDRPLVKALAGVLRAWQEALGFTLLAVDHDPLMLAALCPQVLAIEQGRLVQRGPWAELIARPATPALAALLALDPWTDT